MTAELLPDSVIGDKYRLTRRIGKGGMGEVWSAEQLVTRKSVAMKFLAIDADESAKKRFMREARAACAVRHPNVVEVYDVIEQEDGLPVIVMELMVGESLGDRLRREKKLSVEDTALVFSRVSSALICAHALGVVHRDLKPDNVFLAQTPDGDEVKVIDFGIAKLAPKDEGGENTGALTSTGTMLGTPHYMSPEQAFGEKQIDQRADVWSLGIMVYVCVSGVLPTAADNIGQILKIIMTRAIKPLATVAPDVPPILTDLVDRMLAFAPSDRPSDLAEVKAVFDAIIAGKSMVVSARGLGSTPLGISIADKPLPEATVITLSRASHRAKIIAAAALGVGALLLAFNLSSRYFIGGPKDDAKRGVLRGFSLTTSSAVGAASEAPLAPSTEVTITPSSTQLAPSTRMPTRPATSAAAATSAVTVTSSEASANTANPLQGIVEKPPF